MGDPFWALKHYKEESDFGDKIIKELREENAKLLKENQELKKRIAELENSR